MTNVLTNAVEKQRLGRDAVAEALIQATGELLGEVGPSRMSVRDIADRAGVNKGQIHHYFGGKQALITAAVRSLAQDHYCHTREPHDASEKALTPLVLDGQRPYLRALTRVILDGDLELASLEFREEISVPQLLLGVVAENRGLESPDERLRAGFAAAMAMELGWSAFGPHIMRAIGAVDDPELVERIRDRVAELVIEVVASETSTNTQE
jgi:AcrR family transcriptional regulator